MIDQSYWVSYDLMRKWIDQLTTGNRTYYVSGGKRGKIGKENSCIDEREIEREAPLKNCSVINQSPVYGRLEVKGMIEVSFDICPYKSIQMALSKIVQF